MKLEASRSLKNHLFISLFLSILYTSPLLAVDYVYDKTKLTDDEITRLKNFAIKRVNIGKKKLIL